MQKAYIEWYIIMYMYMYMYDDSSKYMYSTLYMYLVGYVHAFIKFH